MKKLLEHFFYSMAIAGIAMDGSPAGYRMIRELELRKRAGELELCNGQIQEVRSYSPNSEIEQKSAA